MASAASTPISWAAKSKTSRAAFFCDFRRQDVYALRRFASLMRNVVWTARRAVMMLYEYEQGNGALLGSGGGL